MRCRVQLLIICSVATSATALSCTSTHHSLSRSAFCRRSSEAVALLTTLGGLATPAQAGDFEKTSSGLQYKVLKPAPNGAVPKVGDLIAIRFRGSFDGKVFDDITETPEPLYYRVGAGTLIKGIDEALSMMHFGETWSLKIPGSLGFGPKGRPASAGKPRIPANAELEYELSIVGFPGFEGDLIDTVL